MSMTVRPRPVGVSFLAVLIIISGVVDVIAGIVVLANRGDAELRFELSDVTSGSLSLWAGVLIVVGLIALLVGYGLWTGANWARALVLVIAVLRLIALVIGVIAYHSFHWYQGLLPVLVYFLIAGYLARDEGVRAYFRA